ncbi:hypothetical protein OCI51_26430 (plasmid) [Lysinibacillus capsici]|uniref:hypothetical protein n=1 Tax=Lysinibacillus capsici TaxID=2115968 RepID=UPI0021D8FB31|nr:hypothetical protein [Lysinibacillus capsici]UYB50148.1 hypothetical protein OCI51_26820 [Lysinibacillus capsici]UYB50222.1 hypothetical protein OCI51_26430 [Lysinibacillus capsici]
MEKKGVRGQRSDKKRDVKPTLKLDLKDAIYRLSNITYTPVKDVCPSLCMFVIKDRKTIEHLSQFFKRDLLFDNTMFRGHVTNKTISKRINVPGERVTIRFSQSEYSAIALVAFALDCTVSRATAILLEISMSQARFVNAYIKEFLQHELSESQMREFKEILRYINRNGESHHSWASLLAHVVDEVGSPVNRIKEAISNFIDLNWRE